MADSAVPTPNVLPTVLLIGRTGSGKSETGNTLLGRAAFKAQRAFASVTTECRGESNATVAVLDTPGLSDTQEDPTASCAAVAEFVRSSGAHNTVHAVLIIVSATERFTQDLTAGVRLMEAALGEGCLSSVGTVVFTRGGELERDGVDSASLVSGGPPGLRELVERCAGRVALVENRDGLPPASETEAYWEARLARGEALLRLVCPPPGSSAVRLDQSLDATSLRAMPAAGALSAASTLQVAVGGRAASEVTDASLGAAFADMLETMRARSGGQSKLADRLATLSGAYCELHGAQASDEVQRARTEAACLELAEGAKLQVFEGGAVWIDGSAGVQPPAGEERASVLVGKDARLELFGLADLSLSGEAGLEPVPPRVLAQVVHS